MAGEAGIQVEERQLTDNKPLVHYLSEVRKLADQKEYDSAIELLNDVEKNFCDRAEVYHLRGDIFLRQEVYEEAIKSYVYSVKLNPHHFWSQCNLGKAYLCQKRWDDAVEQFHKAMELDPRHEEPYKLLGLLMLHRNEWGEAIALYRKAIEQDEEVFFYLHEKIGDVLLENEKFEDAIVAYEAFSSKSKSIQPCFYQNLSQAYHELGNGFYDEGEYDKAANHQRKAIEILEGDCRYHHALGNALLALHHFSSAIQAYQSAVEINSSSFVSYQAMGKAFFKLDDFSASVKAFQTALEGDRNSFSSFDLAALSCEAAGLREEAMRYWNSFIQSQHSSGLSLLLDREKESFKSSFQVQQEKIESPSKDKENVEKENELLLLQLHQVQEQLEEYFLKCQEQEANINNQKAEIKHQKEILASKEKLENKVLEIQNYIDKISNLIQSNL